MKPELRRGSGECVWRGWRKRATVKGNKTEKSSSSSTSELFRDYGDNCQNHEPELVREGALGEWRQETGFSSRLPRTLWVWRDFDSLIICVYDYKKQRAIKTITYVEDRVLAWVYSLPVELFQGFKYKKNLTLLCFSMYPSLCMLLIRPLCNLLYVFY